MRLFGLTGNIAFGDQHRRTDEGLLYMVVRDGRDHAIRALR